MRSRLVVVPAFVVMCSAAAFAQDFQVGARAKGMGGSYTSFDEDPVAIWLNPAGIAGTPSRLGIDFQTFTQFELEDSGVTLGSVGEPQYGLLEPPIIPSFLGFTNPVAQTGSLEHEIGFALIRPFQNRLTYLNGVVRVQTEQQFSRFRFAGASRWRPEGEGEFLRSVSIGAGLDVAFSKYDENDDAGALDRSETDTRPGWGAGLLVGVYNNGDNFSVDAGVAYQSEINFHFQVDDVAFPVWDWPRMISAGLTVKMLDKQDLRLTIDLQHIFWDRATQNDTTGAGEDFSDATNLSFGAEYYVRLSPTLTLLPRAGYRIYDAPWDDKDLLPAIGDNILSIDTSDDVFGIFTFGASLQWVADNKVRSFDVGFEVGGDAPNFSVGYRYDF